MSHNFEGRMPKYDERTPVLIVGGGLVGLSAAVFLAWHDVACLLVERHPDLLIHPRARGFTPRTVELYRQVGLERAIRAAGYASGDSFEWVAVRAETLASEEYTPAEEQDSGDGFGNASPSSFAPIDQDKLEILLRDRVEELGADVRFSTELTSFEQDDAGVTAVLEDRRTGAERTVRADYLVAADGWDSPVRQRLGIGTDGPGPFFNTVSLMIYADLRPALRGRRVSIAYLQRPRPGTVFLAHDDAGRRWVFGTGYAPEHGESVDDYTDERCTALVRAAAGLPDVEVKIRPQIPSTDLKVLGFTIGAQVAQQYRVGRVFLTGDAAHIVPPTGGLGANTGIQDAHNLGWKLAAVLHGQAGPALLDTYHAERHPLGLFTMQQALARWQSRIGVGGGTDSEQLVDYAAVAFGYRYQSLAVLGAPEDAAPALSPEELTGQAGTRAPHLAITLNGREISTLDLYGRHFVLLAGAKGAAWVSAAEHVARRLDVPLDAYRFGVELAGAEGTVAHGIAPDGSVLIRPDGFVAWRAEAAAEDSERALEHVLSCLLCRATGRARQRLEDTIE
jgi:putative polyketide hydroxylase